MPDSRRLWCEDESGPIQLAEAAFFRFALGAKTGSPYATLVARIRSMANLSFGASRICGSSLSRISQYPIHARKGSHTLHEQ
jgi:hypothetical protein